MTETTVVYLDKPVQTNGGIVAHDYEFRIDSSRIDDITTGEWMMIEEGKVSGAVPLLARFLWNPATQGYYAPEQALTIIKAWPIKKTLQVAQDLVKGIQESAAPKGL